MKIVFVLVLFVYLTTCR